MTNERKIRLAKANEATTQLKNEFINEDIRKDYSQASVEAIMCNALADIISQLRTTGCVTEITEHLKEFDEYNNYRNAVKENVKNKF